MRFWCAIAVATVVASLSLVVGRAGAVNGAWGYFGNPRAVYAHGVIYFGFVNSRGDVGVGAYSMRTHRTRTTVLAPRFGADDHNNASVWVRPDGRIVAFWSPHSGHVLPYQGTSRLYYRVSSAPGSIRRFGPTHKIADNTGGNRLGYTYPSTVYAPGNRTLWLFWRGGDWQPTFARSRDGGRTWSAARTLVRGGRKVYAVYASDAASGFHVALVPDNPSVGINAVYYLHYRGGRWYRADGRVVGRLARRIRFERGDVVERRHGHQAHNSWVLDVAQDPAGHPVVLYRLAGGPNRGYWYARWTGTRWSRHHVAKSGKLHGRVKRRAVGGSMGGATLDHEDPSIVYLSDVDGASAQIQIARTPDGGASWQTTTLRTGSPWPSVRPTSPLGLSGGLAVLWMQGRYRNFHDFDTDIRIWVDP